MKKQFNRNFVKSFRKALLGDPMGRDLKVLGMFTYLLLRVNWKASRFRNEWIHPGSMITSIHNLSAATGESLKVVRRVLSELEQDGIIKKENWANRGTKITVCNWGTYQKLPCVQGRTEGTPEGTPEGTQSKKERKKEGKNITPPPPQARVREDGRTPTASAAWAIGDYVEPTRELVPEYAGLNAEVIVNAMQGQSDPELRAKAWNEFAMDVLGSLKVPSMPGKMLRRYVQYADYSPPGRMLGGRNGKKLTTGELVAAKAKELEDARRKRKAQ